MRTVRQLGARDCGAACLAMILSHHGRSTTLAEARALTPVGRDGITAAAIATAAESEGLTVRGRRLPVGFSVRDVRLPAIVHWAGDHFVVWLSADQDRFRIADPALGTRTMDRQSFDDQFSGVVLEFEPRPDMEPREATPRRVWRRYLRELSTTPRWRQRIAIVFVWSALLQLVALAGPVITWIVLERVLGDDQPDLLWTAIAAAITLVVVGWLNRIARTLSLLKLREHMDRHIETGFVSHTMGLDIEFFDSHSSGDLLGRFASVSLIRQVLTENVIGALIDVVFLCFYAVSLAILAPDFLVVVVIAMAVDGATLALSWRRLHGLRLTEVETEARTQAFVVQMIRGVSSVKAMGAEEYMVARWRSHFDTSLAASISSSRASGLIGAIGPTIHQAVGFVLLILGARTVIEGDRSVGEMVALVGLGMLAIEPFRTIVAGSEQLLQAEAHVERMLEVLETNATNAAITDEDPPRRRIDFRGDVEVRDVSVRYSPDSEPSLRHVSLTIPAESTVAIVGRSGSGKSTLLRVILGLVTPTEGSVRYDDVDSTEIDLHHLRSQVSVVLQEPFMIAGSLRDNVLLGHPGDADADGHETLIAEATKQAGLADELREMPMGLSTIVGETGAGLSGGQLQRLALARAFARRPRLLVLDEATNNLDSLSERLIAQSIDRADCGVVVAAHRLSTIQRADTIAVMHEGAIIEMGTHAELLRRNGSYTALVESQSFGE